MLLVNEGTPPTQRCTCVSLEWPRRGLRHGDGCFNLPSPREMPCGWRPREASSSCSAVNLASQCSSGRRKKQHPKPFYLLKCHVGQSKHRVRWHFLGGSEIWREKTLAGFQVLATPIPLYLYDSALALRQREPSCPRIPTFTWSHLPSL